VPFLCFWSKIIFMIDLHVHLDGSLTKEDLRYLATLNDLDASIVDAKPYAVSPNCHSLSEYLECFDFPVSLLQNVQSISYATYAVLKRFAGEGLLYVELRFAPQKHTRSGLSQEQVLLSAIQGMNLAKNECGIACKLLLCCMREDKEGSLNKETVALAAKYKDSGVAGIDLAGDESIAPNSAYKAVFDYANSLDVPFTMHAGENKDNADVWDAIKMGAKRIGGAANVLADPMLVEFLALTKIPLEMSITSELNTSVIESASASPIAKLVSRGVKVCICTNNTGVSSTTLTREYALIKEKLGLSSDVMKSFYFASVDAAFLDSEQKAFLKELINKKLNEKEND
jgi:adenosine deaminase